MARMIVEMNQLHEVLESGRRWWEPYVHATNTDEEKARALIHACAYWHSVAIAALQPDECES